MQINPVTICMTHLIITTANIPESYTSRKTQYLESINACLAYSHLFDTYTILECVSSGEEYLQQYNTFYSSAGNPYLNKGLNELNHIRAYLQQSALPDDTSIIKLSGRYIMENGSFFEQVLHLQEKFESIFKNDSDIYEGNGYHTFLYYIKKRLFLDTINCFDFSLANMRPIEWDMKNLLMIRDKHIETDKLGVLARQGTNSERIFHC